MFKKIYSLFLLLFLIFVSCNGSKSGEILITADVKSELRAPAYPLVTVDPYFNAWSFTDNLYDEQVKHWTGKDFSFIGAIRVDGDTYRFMGTENLPLKSILSSSNEEEWEGKYTFQKPSNDEWISLDFNDTSWETGKASFGTRNEPNLSTLWETEDIWVRRVFELDEDLADKIIYLHYSHDDIFELYINGTKIVDTGYNWKYNIKEELSDEIKASLKKGKNIITAHGHNRTGGGYVDFGLYEKETGKETFTTTAVQKEVNVLPTRTFYTFECGPVQLELIFTAPHLMDNLDLMTRPVNYITYQVKSTDNKSHDVQIYFETTPQWAVNTDNQKVDFEIIENEGLKYLKTGSVDQKVLAKKGDDLRIDWGYFYMTPGTDNSASLNFGDYWTMKKDFQSNGSISTEVNSELSGTMTKNMTVLALSSDLGNVTSNSVNGYFMLGYDDLYSLQYFEENMMAYWKHNGEKDIFDVFSDAKTNYASIMQKCNEFDNKLMADAQKSGGDKYAELCALVYRQVIAAHKLIADNNGNLIFLSKENFSNGSIGTVDLTYPSSPMFLIYNPELLKGMMNPIFHYSESGKWTKPFAAHDVGTYPIANGQTYGGDMPVEESGNMLILTAAIAAIEGNAEYANSHWDVLTTWTDYLVQEGLDPANQLCTDDFAGHFAHNANLSIKAIMGIASYGKLSYMLGKSEIGDKYMNIAKEKAVKWEQMANDGDHYRLTFDRANTWSQKYNLVWDRLLGFNIFDPQIAVKEMAFYKTKQNEFGLPLDIRRTYTKSDWIMWTAVLTGNDEDFHALTDYVYKYANETPTRIPLSDWHETTDGSSVGFRARSVVGGYYMKMLEDILLSKLPANK